MNPYGDRYSFTRTTAAGPVTVFVDFHNTPGMQRLQIVAQPAGSLPTTNGTHVPEPS